MDWERLRIFARAICQGMTKEQVAGMGYFKIPSDEALWVEANKDPVEYMEMEIETDIPGAVFIPELYDDAWDDPEEVEQGIGNPLVLVKPPKPLTEMTDKEIDEFASESYDKFISTIEGITSMDYEKSFRYYMLISGGTNIDGAREDGYVKDADDEALWNIVLADPDAYSQPVRETCGAVFSKEIFDEWDKWDAEDELLKRQLSILGLKQDD